jgi:hypothetical protein
MQRRLGRFSTISDRISRIATRSIGIAALSALFLSLGSLAKPAAAVSCGVGTVIFGPLLCSSSYTPSPGNPTTFNYDFASLGTSGATVYIPLLDPNAVVAGSFSINGVPATLPIITDPGSIAADWVSASFPDPKSIFDDPSALIAITLGTPTTQTNVSFQSNDPVVSGPIELSAGNYNDPPVPGPVPEPCTLVLLGTALAGIGVRRWRRKTA